MSTNLKPARQAMIDAIKQMAESVTDEPRANDMVLNIEGQDYQTVMALTELLATKFDYRMYTWKLVKPGQWKFIYRNKATNLDYAFLWIWLKSVTPPPRYVLTYNDGQKRYFLHPNVWVFDMKSQDAKSILAEFDAAYRDDDERTKWQGTWEQVH